MKLESIPFELVDKFGMPGNTEEDERKCAELFNKCEFVFAINEAKGTASMLKCPVDVSAADHSLDFQYLGIVMVPKTSKTVKESKKEDNCDECR